MRRPSEFIVWNHVFMAYETGRACFVDPTLFCLALPCTVLSVYRHLHHEQCCNATEPVLAKATMVYLFFASLALGAAQVAVLVASKLVIVAVWLVEDQDYEKIHPWLHVLVGLDAHVYISAVTSG